MKTKYTIIIGLIISLVSCEKEIEFKGSEQERKLVLNTELIVGNTLTAQVFLSNLANKIYNNFTLVENATIDVYQNDAFVESLTYEYNGYYVGSTHNISENSEYTFYVNAPNYNSINGAANTPVNVPILNVDQKLVDQEFDRKEYALNLKIQDNEYEKNYYRIAVLRRHENGLSYVYVTSNDAAREKNWSPEDYIYFTDNIFNGKEYSLEVILPIYDNENHNIIIYLEHISEDYFNYKKAAEFQRHTVGLEMFFQAVQVPCNIEGGFGFIGAINRSVIEYTIEKE